MPYQVCTAKKPIHAKLILPGSEDITYRALCMSVLADGVSEISGLCINDHVNTLINAFRQLGIVIQLDTQSQSCIIAGGNGKLPLKQASLWCANEKIIAYFLIALASASPGVYHFDGAANLHELPLHELLTLLHQQGVDLIPNDSKRMPFTLLGTDSFEGGEISFTHPTDSHFFSAILMISPYARSPFVLNAIDLDSEEEVDITSAIMAEFGVLVHRIRQGQFMVPVPQRYQARDYVVEPDFSLAAYFFAAGAVTGGEVSIQPTKRLSSKQADTKFLSLLEKMGCQVIENHSALTVQGPKVLNGIEVSLRSFSSIFFALAAIAPFATSPTRITHIGKMSYQESGFLSALRNKFTAMSIQVETGANWIKIFPGTPKSISVTHHDDYHIAMALCIIGLKVPGIKIEEPDCISHIHPEFFTLWNRLIKEPEPEIA
jgi:3-phosphoshikimate 1-carboxyvinyltransferase